MDGISVMLKMVYILVQKPEKPFILLLCQCEPLQLDLLGLFIFSYKLLISCVEEHR